MNICSYINILSSPNPACENECRFTHGNTTSTSAYFAPVYDKHGNNLNPDGNIASSSVSCLTCGKKWHSTTQYGKTTYTENSDNN